MARRRTDKFALQVRGLTEDQAAVLAYAVSSLGEAFAASPNDYDFGTSVLKSKLHARYPDADWVIMSAAERRRLV
jgi:hypothetical protein